MNKEIIRNIARYGKMLHNGAKMKRHFSISSVLQQSDNNYTDVQYQLTRSYSLAMTAEKTMNSKACKC